MLAHATMCGFADAEAPLRSRILAMTTPSRSVSIAAILASTVLGVVLLVGALQVPVPALRIQVQIGDAPRRVEEAAVAPRPVEAEAARPVTQLERERLVRPRVTFVPTDPNPELVDHHAMP